MHVIVYNNQGCKFGHIRRMNLMFPGQVSTSDDKKQYHFGSKTLHIDALVKSHHVSYQGCEPNTS
jgi:hypothetical protein